jgi:hypothetical protein
MTSRQRTVELAGSICANLHELLVVHHQCHVGSNCTSNFNRLRQQAVESLNQRDAALQQKTAAIAEATQLKVGMSILNIKGSKHTPRVDFNSMVTPDLYGPEVDFRKIF